MKGLGGFHLVCDAFNDAAVRLLRECKKRSDKPFALMVPNVADAERAALSSIRRPIVILQRRPGAPISESLAPGNSTLGVMLPYTPLHHLLFGDSFSALVMTSGNLSEEPIVTGNREAALRLAVVADAFLFHNGDIHIRVDDSVARVFVNQERVLRRSRGYAPHLPEPAYRRPRKLRNAGLLPRNAGAYEAALPYCAPLRHPRSAPAISQHEARPGDRGCSAHRRQHRHAHIASCMAENGIVDKVIGVAFDGTGFGTDDKIWGGEFLIADFAGFERREHFRYIPLAGGDRAVREPWRLGLSYLIDTFGAQLSTLDLPLFQRVPQKKIATVRSMTERIVHDVLAAQPLGRIAAAFHNTIASIIVEVCVRLRAAEGIHRVCLSGGTFQNVYLVERAVSLLRGGGFEVFLHSKVPPNDGGISLGQAVSANAAARYH
jgi:hydrogenase maturation protein HypF